MASQRLVLGCMLWIGLCGCPLTGGEADEDAGGFDTLRIEQEGKFLVPPGTVEEVWSYLRERYATGGAGLHELDGRLIASCAEELFSDTYFDTPALDLLARRCGVRNRRRMNLSDPTDRKNGRELVQVKLSGISGNALERGEVKFRVKDQDRPRSAEDRHPLLGIVVAAQRPNLVQCLARAGVDAYALKPILTIEDRRRRIYIACDGKPALSLSVDQVSATGSGGRVEFAEIEPEINEITFSKADPKKRRWMESLNDRVMRDLQARFPCLQQDQTPKYNKAFALLASKIPFLRLLIDTQRLCIWMLAVLAILGGLGWWVRRQWRCRSTRLIG